MRLPELDLRGDPRNALLTSLIFLAGVSLADAATPLEVRPLAPRVPIVVQSEVARAVAGSEPARALAQRERRWRSFRDDLMHADDRSQFASRRKGWRAPVAARPRPHVERAPSPLLQGEPDTIRVAFIRIDFRADRGGTASTGNGRFNLSGPDTLAPPIDRPPHNRRFYQAHLEGLKRYYETQSYGQVVIDGDVWPRSSDGAYTLSDMADFGPWEFSQEIFDRAVHLFRSMLFAADSQSILLGDRIPWDDIDRFILIHAGSDLQSDVRGDSPEDIPSFTIGVADSDVVQFPDSLHRPIDRAAIIPETGNQDGFYNAINGVLTHEAGHLLFGFFDLYNTRNGQPNVGFWSLMDSGNLAGAIVQLPDGTELFATGLLPPSLDPWHRFRFLLLDQLPFPEVSYGDTMSLLRSQRHPDVRTVSLSSDEYLMLENRYLAPADSVELNQDDSTRVVLGPKKPDPFEYDALLPGGGILVWHIDESVFPDEFAFPCDSGRANPDCGINSNRNRLGVSLIEADGLADLGDPGSPFFFGAHFDPYFRSNNPSLSDTTVPNLIPHIRTRPHIRLDFLDDPDSTMRFSAFRTWQLPGWPRVASFPPEGPLLLAVDADGDRNLEVCWAGGDTASADSAALFAVRVDGQGLSGPAHAFATLDRRPRPPLAALPLGESLGMGEPPRGPSYFAVATLPDGPDTTFAGGRVWLLDHFGRPLPGWPPPLPEIVTTPPVIAGQFPNATVYVGCADGRIYGLGLDGTVLGRSEPPLASAIRGRLAVYTGVLSGPAGAGAPHVSPVAAGSGGGEVGVFDGFDLTAWGGWPRVVAGPGFEPDFLWIDFGGALNTAQDCFRGALSLVVHHADWLWAFCADGTSLPGWGRDVGDTLVAGLGAGDPDGDGFPEVLTHSVTSGIAFWNLSGHPSPGWPKRGTKEHFRTGSPPLGLDLNRDGRGEVLAMNASGIIAAVTADGKTPTGWPLASGLGAIGAPVAADLDRDGHFELVAPDRRGLLYGYSVPVPVSGPRTIPWTMLGGDPGRTAALILEPEAVAPAPSLGPLVHGSLKAFPNPARRRPVSFAYQLSEPADVEFRVLDTSGNEVASFARRGRQSDNLEVWDPGRLPAGLYLVHVRFRSAAGNRVEILPVGLLR